MSVYLAIQLLTLAVAVFLSRREWKHVWIDLLFNALAFLGFVSLLVNLTESPVHASVLKMAGLLGVKSFLINHKVIAFFAFLLWTTYITYWTHRLAHKVQALWELHKVHHSATKMTGVNWARVHPLEDFFVTYASVILSVLLVPEIGPRSAALYGLLVVVHNIVIHSNWKMTWGMWSWISVSPAAHQIHHSTNPKHFNANYGSPFSFWDRLHGTYVDPLKSEAPERFGVEGVEPTNVRGLVIEPVVRILRQIIPTRASPSEVTRVPSSRV